MVQLEKLPEVTNHVLAGLQADESLKHRIFLSASETKRSTSPFGFRTVIALCSLSVLLVLLCLLVTRMPVKYDSTTDIHVIPAGGHRMVSPVNMQQVIDQVSGNGDVLSVETEGAE